MVTRQGRTTLYIEQMKTGLPGAYGCARRNGLDVCAGTARARPDSDMATVCPGEQSIFDDRVDLERFSWKRRALGY